jgi:hypothetical protein
MVRVIMAHERLPGKGSGPRTLPVFLKLVYMSTGSFAFRLPGMFGYRRVVGGGQGRREST